MAKIAMDISTKLTVRDIWNQQCMLRANHEFLVFEDPVTGTIQRFSYREFDLATNQIANVFLRLGVKSHDQVLLQICNSVEFIECLIGLAKIGAVAVPLNTSYTTDECRDILSNYSIRVAVSEYEISERTNIEQLIDGQVIVIGSRKGLDYQKLKEAEPVELQETRPIDSDDLLAIICTSGTERSPKGVMLTHSNFVFSGFYVNWQLNMIPQDRYLTTMSAALVNFQLSALMPVLTMGATLILERRYSATRFWNEVRNHKATLIQAMAMIVRTLLLQPVSPDEKDHCVRDVHYFLPIPNDVKEVFEKRFGVKLFNNYGSTETLVGVITDIPNLLRHWPAIGRVGLGYQTRLVDAKGSDVPAGELGEILVRGVPGKSLALGYWNDTESTERVFDNDGWFHTGDIGKYDDEGWIYFVDRRNEIIKVAGENVSVSEIENILQGCPGIKEVAVVGIPDEIRDEAIKAVVVPEENSSITSEVVIDYAAKHLAYFKVPNVIEMRKSLPCGSYGKVKKNLLKIDY